MIKTLQISNVISVIFVIAANAVTASSIITPSIQQISQKYETLLNPARYAFSIWSLIFIMISLLAVYQASGIFDSHAKHKLVAKMSGWFVLANIMAGIWTYVFLSGYIGLSVLIILTLLFSLFMLIRGLNIALYDAPFKTIFFVWWPILLYTGWVLVAAVVNTASFLTTLGVTITPLAAAITLVALGGILLYLLKTRNVRSLVLASVWGISAISFAQHGQTPLVWITAAAVSTILLTATGIHAYRHRETNPINKFLT